MEGSDMLNIQKIIILLVLFVITLFSVPSCAPTVSQQEYDRLNNELSETKGQIAAQQSKLAEAEIMQGQYEELNENYEDLKKQHDIKMSEIETIESQYDDLTTEYEALQEQYDVIMEGTAGINTEDVEQAIFALVNQERRDRGIDELVWGKNLYTWSKANSRHMEEKRTYQDSEYVSFQEVFWAAGYSTLDGIANGALLTWRANSYRYEQNIINPAIYGAVGAYKSGDIIYITYMADVFK
jgi:uncharacterized protein YkwD